MGSNINLRCIYSHHPFAKFNDLCCLSHCSWSDHSPPEFRYSQVRSAWLISYTNQLKERHLFTHQHSNSHRKNVTVSLRKIFFVSIPLWSPWNLPTYSKIHQHIPTYTKIFQNKPKSFPNPLQSFNISQHFPTYSSNTTTSPKNPNKNSPKTSKTYPKIQKKPMSKWFPLRTPRSPGSSHEIPEPGVLPLSAPWAWASREEYSVNHVRSCQRALYTSGNRILLQWFNGILGIELPLIILEEDTPMPGYSSTPRNKDWSSNWISRRWVPEYEQNPSSIESIDML